MDVAKKTTKLGCASAEFIGLPTAFTACDSSTFVVKEPVSANDIVSAAQSIIEKQIQAHPITINNASLAKQLVQFKLSGEKSEVFCVLFLTNQYRLIRFEKLFQGTINRTPVYPREVARRALEFNAAAIMLVHNHPSGQCEPSHADIQLTQEMLSIFRLLDIEIVDHFIVGGRDVYSFAENAQL